jgi:uncharacterized protein YebE (UPF0316 family)
MNILFVVWIVNFTYLSHRTVRVVLDSANKLWMSKFRTPHCGIYIFKLVPVKYAIDYRQNLDKYNRVNCVSVFTALKSCRKIVLRGKVSWLETMRNTK